MRLVIVDTNVVVSAALKSGSKPSAALFAAMHLDTLAISAPVAAEYRLVLGRPKFARAIPGTRLEDFVSSILTKAVMFEPSIDVRACRDPSDDMYLELALEAGASVIISGDADLLELDPWRGTRILTASADLDDIAGRAG